jgi:hypothetical protein
MYDVSNSWTAEGSVTPTNGTICSGALTWASRQLPVGQLTEFEYPPAIAAAEIRGIRTGVINQCNGGSGFFSVVGNVLETAACVGYDFCSRAANQVANTITANNPGDNSESTWSAWINAGNGAWNVTPDRVGGWSGNVVAGTGGWFANHPTSGPGSSVWAPYGGNAVSYNSDGGVLGCWD